MIPDLTPPGAHEDLTRDELLALDPDLLIDRCLGLQRAYTSLYNAVTLYKRQLVAVRDHTLKSGQIADLSRKVNIADVNVIAEVTTRDLARFFGAAYGALFLFDAESNLLTLQHSRPEVAEQVALDLNHDKDVMTVHLLRTYRQPVVITGLPHYEAMAGEEFRVIPAEEPLVDGGLLCPLVVSMQGQDPLLIGVALFGGKEGGFTRSDAEIATMMGEMLSTAISTAQLIEQMSLLAETDGLTGLYNHRHFQQELNRSVATSNRYGHPLSLAMIDIDHFKKFNDTHGHQAGDHILREVTRLIRLSVRDTVDVAARYGGEEFAVVMPNTPLQGAEVACERLRKCVEQNAFRIGGQSVSVTISIGVAEYQAGQEKSMFVDAADTALYRAKRQGRNRVEMSQPDHFG